METEVAGYTISEHDERGRHKLTYFSSQKGWRETLTTNEASSLRGRERLLDVLVKVFLPAGYPKSVSSDYVRYQILNALQAFCNSLASLLSSRAILEGFGVGDPSATATYAMLLTVLQDVFSRLTTIFAAYMLGSSLYPEAKTYRLLADILNDLATILDTLSPLLNRPSLPGMRISALCLSASLRALCGVAAGGSKAAITLHFASPASGTGDVGDLNAKDASKETVLALLGMLLGSYIVPHLTSPQSIFSVLFITIALHVAINYIGVRGLEFRTLNQQRATITWLSYVSFKEPRVLSPAEVARAERLFEKSGLLRDIKTGVPFGHCTIGSSLSEILREPPPQRFLELFKSDRYLLWFDPQPVPDGFVRLHICFKAGYKPSDQLFAWLHAVEMCRVLASVPKGTQINQETRFMAIETARSQLSHHFATFRRRIESAGWNIADVVLMPGMPKSVVTAVHNGRIRDTNDKKIQ